MPLFYLFTGIVSASLIAKNPENNDFVQIFGFCQLLALLVLLFLGIRAQFIGEFETVLQNKLGIGLAISAFLTTAVLKLNTLAPQRPSLF